ncbi:HAMP domain-containing protein [Paenibacillus albicereus]|uniref:histidine kinase n=1 Tax=Paenibacillus albicereus TaxID=2726185 RepID=A0A6H2H1L4_9BACL|nr:sensor histidine kinase [Paenibacillus albicereus]QJC53560.1 HAMP domain-containing protein [Paenibacillus albicereus]
MRSLRTKMVFSYLLLIFLTVVVLGGVFLTLIWNYYYGSASSAMKQRVVTSMSLHARAMQWMSTNERASYMLQSMAEADTRIQLLQPDGMMFLDSDGFSDNRTIRTPDVVKAAEGDTSTWIGKDETSGERIVAASAPLLREGRIISVVRYTAALGEVDRMVTLLVRMTLLTGAAVILLFLALSIWMANRIVRPLRELTRRARHMADGDWQLGVSGRRGRDEIGQLSDTLHTLAVELNKREKLKNDFISSVSHELRTPLTSIKGWSETLADPGSRREEVQEGLGIIARETERLTGLVEDLLDFSNLSSGSMDLHVEELDLNLPVRECVTQQAVRQEETGVRLLSLLEPAPLHVRGDANRLRQVLINLIDNAFKFTPEGGSIRVSAHREGAEAVLLVADSGVGIAPEDLPHVTDKFYKGLSARPGSGLGLAICKEIAEQHGGSLRIGSEPGAGTTVELRLPLTGGSDLPPAG